MNRRVFISVLGGTAAGSYVSCYVSWPLAARAQQRVERLRRVAVLVGPAEADIEAQRRTAAFRKRMQELGWIEGQAVSFDFRWGAGDTERIARHAAELVATRPDVIMANSTPVVAALKRATASIPIVFAVVADPVGDGFVASLSRPGGNLTGFSSFDPEIGGKWVQMLKEVAPAVRRIGLLFNPRTAPGGGWPFVRQFVEAAARSTGVEAFPIAAHTPDEIHGGLLGLSQTPGGGLVAMPDSFVVVNAEAVIRSVEQQRMPAIYPFRFFSEQGGLMSYGVDAADLNVRAASYVDRILRGEKPADLPVQAPTRYELSINLKTAKTLGLDMPPTLLATADEVIE
jgi:putative tryptophan/tyrosine transport system substrate-binding protein